MGKIIDIESDGLLIIDIPNRALPWQADPSDMEKIENFRYKLLNICVGAVLNFFGSSSPVSICRLVIGLESKQRYLHPNMDGRM